jgi:hypothetical protein
VTGGWIWVGCIVIVVVALGIALLLDSADRR